MLAEILEFAMLFTFGFSWPFAIAKTYRAKRVDGKSPLFMIIVLCGYACVAENDGLEPPTIALTAHRSTS